MPYQALSSASMSNRTVNFMAVVSGPAGLVLAGPVFTVSFETAHAQIINNE